MAKTLSQEELYRRIKVAVAQEEPEKIGQLNETLATYGGDYRLLKQFLDLFGSNNPYQASRQAVLKQAVFRTPTELRREGEIYGISVSGHKLTDQIFVLAHKYDPTRVWRSGSEAITKILEAFGTAEQKEPFTPVGKEKIRQHKKEQVQKTMREVVQTLEEVLQDPEKIADVQSRNDRLKVHHILELDEELKRRLLQLDKVVYGNTALMNTETSAHLLALDKGGMLMGWFERKNKAEELPPAIRDIYTTIVNPVLAVPEEERRFMFGSLIAYAAGHMYVQKEAVIGGYLQDLELIMKEFPEEHPVVQQHGKPDLTAVRSILTKPEITLLEATTIFDVYPVDEVRREINQHHFQKYQEEIEPLIGKLTPLFIQNGKWREDCYGASVPMSRLKTSLYASVLSVEDFHAVRDWLRLKTLTQNNEARFFQAQSLKEFIRHVDSLVAVSRKLTALERTLADAKVVIEDPEVVDKKKLPKILLKGKEYSTAERFAAREGIELSEVVQRCSYGEGYSKEWGRVRGKVAEAAKARLYSEKVIESIRPLLERVKQYVLYAQKQAEVEEATNFVGVSGVGGHSLLKGRFWTLPHSNQPYLKPEELQRIQKILKAKKELEQLIQTVPNYTALIWQRQGMLHKTRVYAWNEKYQRVESNWYSGDDEPKIELQGIEFTDPQKLGEHLKGFTAGAVFHSSVSQEWWEKLDYLTHRYYYSDLACTSKGIRDDIQRSGEERKIYLHSTLVQKVEQWYEQQKKSLKWNAEVIASGEEELSQGKLKDKYQVQAVGGTIEQRERFRYFLTVASPGKKWDHLSNLYQDEVAELTNKLAEFNQRDECEVKLEVRKK